MNFCSCIPRFSVCLIIIFPWLLLIYDRCAVLMPNSYVFIKSNVQTSIFKEKSPKEFSYHQNFSGLSYKIL